MNDTVLCDICGKAHAADDMELVLKLPQAIVELDDQARADRCDISQDVCAIDRSRFFVRGLLPIPVRGRRVPYRIGAWAEVTSTTFGRIHALWDDPSQADEPPLPATLANEVPLVASTLGLPLDLRLTGTKTRPEFFIRDATHPLAVEQREGVEAHRALAYTDRQRHG